MKLLDIEFLAMHFVKQVSYVSEYKLVLTFEDNTARLVDLANELDGEIFEPLNNIDYFKTVCVDPNIDTIVWDNGADMAPEFLYEKSAPASESVKAA